MCSCETILFDPPTIDELREDYERVQAWRDYSGGVVWRAIAKNSAVELAYVTGWYDNGETCEIITGIFYSELRYIMRDTLFYDWLLPKSGGECFEWYASAPVSDRDHMFLLHGAQGLLVSCNNDLNKLVW